ncbi:ester cyclase [Streptomyces chiangmaiensis]|uniref:Ester cyclase n=1 Tax=Streptomyces chiangmaiensis TaxID=766497 RepID=A0ABU7FNX9_9ACTN|nr:ester cyclase [Streptomyces chiangmaiensis]MED7825830.1 ester cyclase [Streptomyces chiangmaiensis]
MNLTGLPARLYEAYNHHDPLAVARLYDAGATHEEIAQGSSRQGPEAIADGLRRFFQWFPDAHWQPQTQITDPNGPVAITYLLTATLQAPMGPLAARGQRLSLRGVHVLHLGGELIRGSADYWDAATFHRQMNTTTTGETA